MVLKKNGTENISKFSTKISIEIQLGNFRRKFQLKSNLENQKKVGFQIKFSSKFSRYFRYQKNIFKITYLHDFFMEFQKSGCKMKLRCCTIRWHRIDNDCGLRDCCTGRPTAPKALSRFCITNYLFWGASRFDKIKKWAGIHARNVPRTIYFEKYVQEKLQTKYERFSLKNKKHLPITVSITVYKTLTLEWGVHIIKIVTVGPLWLLNSQ